MKQQQNYHGYLGYQWARRIAQSRFLRGKSVRFPQLVEAYCILFQTGAVLGRAMSTRADAHFAELFAEPGRGADLAPWFREAGEGVAGESPSPSKTAFFELSMTQLQKEFTWEGGTEGIYQLRDKWVSLEDAARELGHAVVLGVCLGVARPDFVEQLWSKTHETLDRSAEARRMRYELGLSEEPEPWPLKEFEQQALLELAVFVRAYYPSLVETLDLAIPGAE